MANFDFTGELDLTTYIFGSYAFNPEIRKPYKPEYKDLYSSMNVIENLGTSFYFILLSLIARLVLFYLSQIQKLLKQKRIRALDWLIRKLHGLLSW